MSPLGTLVATPNSTASGTGAGVNHQTSAGNPLHHHHPHLPSPPPHHSFYNFNDPLLRLMSLSLVREPGSTLVGSGGGQVASGLGQLHCHPAAALAAAAAAAAAMQYKPGNLSPSGSTTSSANISQLPDSPPPLPPSTPFSSNNHCRNNNNDDDEVLSIGRENEDDQSMIIDCDSSTMSHEEEGVANGRRGGGGRGKGGKRKRKNSDEDEEDDEDECLDIVTDEDNNVIHSPSPSESSLPHYASSEDGGGAGMPGSNRAEQERNQLQTSRESLMFSIANILRPDFGLGQTSPTPPSKSLLHLNHFPSTINPYRHLHHHGIKYQPSTPIRKHHHSSKPSKYGGIRPEPTIPIDLSRPGSNDGSSSSSASSSAPTIANIISPVQHRKKSSHHHPPPAQQLRGHHQRRSHHHSEEERGNAGGRFEGKGEENNKHETHVTSTTHKNNNSNSKNSTDTSGKNGGKKDDSNLWPAWVYCTRYSDRPSSGPRTRRGRKKEKEIDEKRPRTAFTADQLARLKREFDENRYLTEKRRQDLAKELRLHENQIKIWFQNKRAKLKKANGQQSGLALQLMAQGLYNHSTIPPKSDFEGDDSD